MKKNKEQQLPKELRSLVKALEKKISNYSFNWRFFLNFVAQEQCFMPNSIFQINN